MDREKLITREEQIEPQLEALLDSAGLAIVLRVTIRWLERRAPKYPVTAALREAYQDYWDRYNADTVEDSEP